MQYLITGNTFAIKEDLKAYECVWAPDKKAWITPYLLKDEWMHTQLKSLTKTCGCFMVKVELSKECRKIQDILNGI